MEQTPPLFYVVTRASLGLLGDNAVALRFPELAGVLVAASCTLVAVTRRATIAHGALAAVLLLGTQATFYAHEARPYGIVLGLVALCYLLWQLRVDGGGLLLVVGLGAAAAAAVAMHYYAVLALAPFVVGEAVRTTLRRRPDAAVIAALGCALLPLLAAAPLIEGARAYSGSFWTEFSWRSALEFNGWLFRTSAVSDTLAPLLELSLLVWLVCGLALHALLAPRLAGPRPCPNRPPRARCDHGRIRRARRARRESGRIRAERRLRPHGRRRARRLRHRSTAAADRSSSAELEPRR